MLIRTSDYNLSRLILMIISFVDCAFASGADYIVSEDSHYDVIEHSPFPTFNVLTMDEFMKKL